MPTIHPNALPMAGLTALVCDPVARRNDGAPLRYVRRADPYAVERVWLLSWQNVRHEVVDAVWRHYREHSGATFWFVVPRTAETVPVRWRTPPSASFGTSSGCNITGEIEQALTYE